MRLLLGLLLLLGFSSLMAKEPLLQPNDVVALIGGEDMVVAAELGYLETLVQAALPEHKLKFRSLAWEGDTVFEQRRDLNYPPLEAQLEKMGATVVIAQFGQMESLAGTRQVGTFIAAYEKLLDRLGAGKGRRFLLVAPAEWRPSNLDLRLEERNEALIAYRDAIAIMAEKSANLIYAPWNDQVLTFGNSGTRDGMHLSKSVHPMFAGAIAAQLVGKPKLSAGALNDEVRQAVVAKSRLWYHYSRPQNWAFLAGDRTNQPSSRDHLDRNKRWFPDELEQFVPLIEAKDKEIWELAAKLNR